MAKDNCDEDNDFAENGTVVEAEAEYPTTMYDFVPGNLVLISDAINRLVKPTTPATGAPNAVNRFNEDMVYYKRQRDSLLEVLAAGSKLHLISCETEVFLKMELLKEYKKRAEEGTLLQTIARSTNQDENE